MMREVRDIRAGRGRLSLLLLALICLLGWAALLGPFFLAAAPGAESGGHSADAPLVFALLAVGLLALLAAESSAGQLNARATATLATMTAINAVLRLPAGPGDSPTFFFLIILAGYVFGGRFGFLLGGLSLFVSALLTAGIGPWVPFQMLSLGWLGLLAGGLPALRWLLRIDEGGWGEVALLAAFGWISGFLFGATMNLTFWPFLALGSQIGWEPGLGLTETLRRYWAFYLTTSLAWDATRALGNVIFLSLFSRPLLRVLRRFKARFWWENG